MSAPTTTAARVDASVTGEATVTKLGPKSVPDEVVTEDDAKDVAKLARMLGRLLADVAALRRRWIPRHLDFDDITTTATSTNLIQLQHNFGGRVRWWVVDFKIIGASGTPQIERDSANTDNNTLVLKSYTTSLISVRVEEAG